MKSFYLALIISAIAASILEIDVCHGSDTNINHDSVIIISVTRRTYEDLYHPADSPHMRCEEQETFMIEERRCMKNENVFKAFHVTVHDFSSRRPILQLRSRSSEITLNTSQHHDKELALDCHIASLEVVRGLEKTFEIDHSGFSFTSANSTLKVDKETLAYSPTEYVGELYHIKILCAEHENDYIFVVWGTTNVTETKFNCTIPGTVDSHSIDCPALQTTVNSRGPSKGSVVAGTVVGIFAVLALGLLLCTFAAVMCIKKSRRLKVSAITSRTLEHKSSTMYKKCDVKNEKDIANEKCILYATPGELLQSTLYGCESNPAYKESGVSQNESEEQLGCDNTVIPRHLNPCYEHTEEPIYHEYEATSLHYLQTTEMVATDSNTETHSEDVLYEPVEPYYTA